MDTESLSSSEGKQPAAVDEVRASTSESLDYEAYGFSGLLQSPPRQSFPRWNEDLFEVRNEIPRIDHDDNHKTSFRVLDSFLNCKDVLGGLPSQIEERNEAS